jgi:hypothetical protein
MYPRELAYQAHRGHGRGVTLATVAAQSPDEALRLEHRDVKVVADEE